MRTMLLCGVLLGLAACGREQPNSDGEPKVDLPRRTTSVAVEPAGSDSITITLTADRRILALGRSWSLYGLDGLLKTAIRRDGPSYYASTVVRLRIDRAAPWLHVRWLGEALARRFVHEIRFVYADVGLEEADVRCRISSLIGDPAEPTYVEVLRVRILVDEEGRLRCGERTAADASAASGWTAEAVERMRQEKLAAVRGEIVPRNGTSWGAVAAVFERLRAAGATGLGFAGGYLQAPENARSLERLPLPDPETAARPADGGRGRGGMYVQSEWPNAGEELGPEWGEPDPDSIPLEEPEPPAPDDVDDR